MSKKMRKTGSFLSFDMMDQVEGFATERTSTKLRVDTTKSTEDDRLSQGEVGSKNKAASGS